MSNGENQNSQLRLFGRRLLWSAVIGALIGFAIISYKAFPVVHQTLDLATIRKQQPVTELYFDNYQQLPTTVTPGRPITFSFHIINHMDRTWTYDYLVTDVTATSTSVLKTGAVTVPDAAGLSQSVEFTPTTSQANSEITVTLANPSQHIDFWVAAP